MHCIVVVYFRRHNCDVIFCVSSSSFLAISLGMHVYEITPCVEKNDRQYFVHNFNRFEQIVLIFGKQHHEDTVKLLKQMSNLTSSVS